MKEPIKQALATVQETERLGNDPRRDIGNAAEVIAVHDFGMKMAPVNTPVIDGHLPDGQTIQVKGWSCSRIQTYGGGTFFRVPVEGADMLLVILIYSQLLEYEKLYFGKSDDIGEIGLLHGEPVRQVFLHNLQGAQEINRLLEKCQREH